MSDADFMRLALRLARRGYGMTSPNPMVGAVLVKRGKIIGRGWHRRAGEAHAEIEALRDAQKRGHSAKDATLYVTLEPCSSHGRTPPCTQAIIAAGIKRVVAGAIDPNPKHSGRAFRILNHSGIEVVLIGGESPSPLSVERGRAAKENLAAECARLNRAFNHWIVHRTPFVTVKAAMTLDGKIATASGKSKWITGKKARAYGMKLRQGSDAILVGVNTVLADDPRLTDRSQTVERQKLQAQKRARRIVLDSMARTPVTAKVVKDKHAIFTTIVVSKNAPVARVRKLAKLVNVWVAPTTNSTRPTPHRAIDLCWLLQRLGSENVTSLLVEGGGEVNASFLFGSHAQRVTFFYAPKILGGRNSRKSVAGEGMKQPAEANQLCEVKWQQLGEDLLLLASTQPQAESRD